MRKRLTAAFLCLCLLFTLLPATAFAEGETGSGAPQAGSALCEHHPQHDESCGYTEGTAEIPCSHEHTEDCYTLVTECVHEHTAECYPAESVSENTATPSEPEEAEPTACTHECSEESGCMTKILDCKHEHKVNGGEADREGGLGRDEACGYVPATAGTPCTFVCEVCKEQDSGNPATPSDEQPEECTCETLCTGEEINANCPVCSAEGAELDKVCVGAAPMLPVTALAAEGAPNSLYVGNQQVISGSDITYWTTGTDGQLTKSTDNQSWNVKYDPTSVTLTLNGATIQGETNTGSVPFGAGIYALCSEGQSVALTIELIGTNTITGYYGIYVNAEISADSYGTDASLTITGESNGSLKVSGSYHGIYVKSGTGGASLNINDASVVASSSSSYFDYAGVYVQSSAHATSSPQLSLKVNGGSLTASASEGNDGIQFYVGSSKATDATTSLTVTDHAIVDARNGGISASGVSGKPNVTIGSTGSTGSTGGIVFDGTEGTVYGDVTLDESLTINQGETLTIPEGSSLNGNGKLTNNGTIIVEKGGNLTGDPGGKVVYAPAITNHPQDVEVKENETANFTVEATGTDLSYQWQQNMNGSGWTDITGETNATYTTGKTTMDMNGTQYRCVVKNSVKEVTSNTATLTVQKSMTPIEPEFVRYIVEHYKQNADGSYTLADTEQPIDEIGKTVTATPKTYEGYTYNPNAAGTVVNGTLKEISSPDDIVTLKLYYDITLYTVTVNGSYAQTTGAGSYAEGATVTIDAGTRSGYTFDGWTSSDGVTFANAGSAQTTFTMPDKTVTVTANWTKKSTGGGGGGGSSYDYFTISASAGTGGSISPSGNISVREGRDQTFTITPDGGYCISDVRVDGVSVGAVSSYTFDNVQKRHTIEAIFAKENPGTGNPFTDVHPDDWFYNDVMFVYQNGLMNGTSATTFEPNMSTTRAMIVAMLARLENVTSADSAGFTDVSGSDWYATAVNWAASEGIVGGFGDGTFQPNDAITREQMAAILMNYAEYKGQDVSARADLSSYADAADVSTWAEESVQWAVSEGLLKGMTDDILAPQGNATRAQVAAILERFLER